MRSRGFTLIEALVVVSILGILAILLILAVQSSRSASRRIACTNNLRQLGIAMTSYLGREGVFPSAMLRGSSAGTSSHSPFVRILSDLDQASVFNGINFAIAQNPLSISPENVTAARIHLAVFACPADESSPIARQPGSMSYRCNLGSSANLFPDLAEPRLSGAFVLERSLGSSDFRDGQSSTALLSERLRGDDDPSTWDVQSDSWFARFAGRRPTPDQAIELCNLAGNPLPPHYSSAGWTWFLYSYDTTFYNHVATPNGMSPDCSSANSASGSRGASDSGVYAARSLHASSVSVLAADGSLRRIPSSIAKEVWRAFGTRSGGEILGPDF